jgi:histidine ammonia-lyase
LERILAIEYMVSMQALDYRSPLKSSDIIENTKQKYRKVVPILRGDRILNDDILKTISFLRGYV